MSSLQLSRRRLLAAGGAVGLLAVAPGGSLAAETPIEQPSAEEALERLLAGNARYVDNTPLQRPPTDRASLAAGQAPFAAILACADSRVAPELVFDQGPGDLFVVRIAGNFVTDYVLGSLEYAVAYLNVPLILVMGHSGCGAVAAALKTAQQNATFPGNVGSLAARVQTGLHDSLQTQPELSLEDAVVENSRSTVEELERAGSILPRATVDGRLQITAALHTLTDGRVTLL
ncbi:MAG TPA: carbonic anhydrase [Kiloniellales bacterium]|jgi:carbonic anhydrase|nr:carbonic anhydrase [Kiloniellales bacterium]